MYRYIQTLAGRIAGLAALCLVVLSLRAVVHQKLLINNLDTVGPNRILAHSLDSSSFNSMQPLNKDKESLIENRIVIDDNIIFEKLISVKKENEKKYLLKRNNEIDLNSGDTLNLYNDNQNHSSLKNINKETLNNSKLSKEKLSKSTENTDGLPTCPMYPPSLKGPLKVQEEVLEVSADTRQGVTKGGSWAPTACKARYRLAVIVPYRAREKQVLPFLQHMHGLLKLQQLNYTIYFIEQHGEDLFNRAILLNVGYVEAKKEGPWDCYAFHDVDMLPEDDRNLYHCSLQPRHLAVATSAHKYRSASTLSFYKYYGGAALMTSDQIDKVNGWSNRYWGWGGEDDDMWRRIALENMAVWRLPPQIARYKMLGHKPQTRNEKSHDLVNKYTGDHPKDGLNTLKYKLLNVNHYDLYTSLVVDISSNRDVT